MGNLDITVLAQDLLTARETGSIVVSPSARDASFDLAAAYAVETEIARVRTASGRHTAGWKVGYANKAVWRVFKLDTVVWARMYDDTLHYVNSDNAELALPFYRSPKIEPEIVFKLKDAIPSGDLDAANALQYVEWIALGFEIIDCPFPDWRFQPTDFVAAYGLHTALAVGQPLPIETSNIARIAKDLASFKIRVSKNGDFVEEGSGKNSLRNPALCLAELAGAKLRQSEAPPLAAGELISSGTLTSGHPIAKGEQWQAVIEGLPLSRLSVKLI
jgi:2-oxo-3-hexenedioate decarboxylase